MVQQSVLVVLLLEHLPVSGLCHKYLVPVFWIGWPLVESGTIYEINDDDGDHWRPCERRYAQDEHRPGASQEMANWTLAYWFEWTRRDAGFANKRQDVLCTIVIPFPYGQATEFDLLNLWLSALIKFHGQSCCPPLGPAHANRFVGRLAGRLGGK